MQESRGVSRLKKRTPEARYPAPWISSAPSFRAGEGIYTPWGTHGEGWCGTHTPSLGYCAACHTGKPRCRLVLHHPPSTHHKIRGHVMKMQAYLGQHKLETLAEGEGDPAHPYAVVKDSALDGAVWVGTFPDEASAVRACNEQWSATSFGVLCRVRPAVQQYTFTRGIPVAVEAANV